MQTCTRLAFHHPLPLAITTLQLPGLLCGRPRLKKIFKNNVELKTEYPRESPAFEALKELVFLVDSAIENAIQLKRRQSLSKSDSIPQLHY